MATTAAIAGCSALTGDQEKTPSETTPETATTTSTPKGDVATAIRTARKELADAWDELLDHKVVVDSSVLLTTANIAGFNPENIRASATTARTVLEEVRSEATANQETTINVLLVFGSFVEAKANQYKQLFAAYEDTDDFLSAYAGRRLEDALPYIQQAEREIAKVEIAGAEARNALQGLGTLNARPDFMEFSLETEQRELSVLSTLVAEYSAGITGMRAYNQAWLAAFAGTEVWKNGNYVLAEQKYTAALKRIKEADSYLETALERNIRYHTSKVREFECLASGLVDVFDLYKQAAVAKQQGNDQKAQSLRDQGSEKYRTTAQECHAPSNSS